ncbi:MAG: 30S ribosomal protein S6 [Anaerolineales bacterium]|nr:30S ribosomal protein S6 [Anaerolineales bacterium]
MRDYEVTIIVQPELEEQARNELLERVQGWLAPEAATAEAMTVDHWGMRELAYPIQNMTRGYYVYYEVAIDPARVREIERNLQFAEAILRYLFIRKES